MILNITSRQGLMEGRINNVAFAILRKIKEGVYQTVTPFSFCKDYLNDAIYGEIGGFNTSLVFGFRHTYSNLMGEDNPFIYLGISPTNQTGLAEVWNANYKNTETFINGILKEYLKITTPLTIEQHEVDSTKYPLLDRDTFFKENSAKYGYIVTIPTSVIKNPYYISLISYWIRIGVSYVPENTPTEYVELLFDETAKYDSPFPDYQDRFRAKDGLKRLIRIKKDINIIDKYPYQYTQNENMMNIHGNGFMSL